MIQSLAIAALIGLMPVQAQKNETKGQGQLAGANGQFGTIYSLQNGFNFVILSAKYSVEPYISYEMMIAGTDEKLVVLDIAIKNASKGDAAFNGESFMTLVDDKGQLYTDGSYSLASKGKDGVDVSLKPGQGLGQPELKDPYRVCFKVPGKARVVKIIVNKGRLGKQEELLRYYVAGATKAEAGEAGDAKNIVAALPPNVRDAKDASGAVALDEGKAVAGTSVPSGGFALRFDGLAFSSAELNGSAPEDDKKFAIATITATSLLPKDLSMFDLTGGDAPLYELTDSAGERAKPAFFRKADKDEEPDHEFKKGDEYKFRVVFLVPKDATFKKLVIGAGGSRKWAVDVSAVK